ncbi:MAG: beta-ketoacyl synthase N-terminal-like domain-containing protein [Streptosporangiaceae bacterium]
MTDGGSPRGGQPIAIVGLACRFPDADDPAALLDVIMTGRRAFRRMPPCRVSLADYYSADPGTPDATYSTRAALIEGWQFDRAAFGVTAESYLAADPAHWLALETAARALAAAGCPGGAGLHRDRVGVFIGNSLGGDVSRAAAIRLRWPYVRQAVAGALAAGQVPAGCAREVLRRTGTSYLAPFPPVGGQTLAGGRPAGIAAGISSHFGFRGGAQAIDGAGASSLLAVTAGCAALAAGDLDMALAGGVDLSLDPLELVGLAKAGRLAAGAMRIYDRNPTGLLPGEGCGVLLLMRAADARAAGLPAYATIAGWGVAAAGQDESSMQGQGKSAGSVVAAAAQAQLLALRRAYERAGADPADVALIEGYGGATASADEAELAALAQLRAGARNRAALGSVTANIGHARAASGAAGLIKTVLALSTGVIPPTTGVSEPHPLARDSDGRLHLPAVATPWPAGPRLAGVSTMDQGGSHVHVVLQGEQTTSPKRARPAVPAGRPAAAAAVRDPAGPAGAAPGDSTVFLLHGPDRETLAGLLTRLAAVAPWLSDAELQDLSCHLARTAAAQGQARVALVASRQEQLARLAAEARTLLPRLPAGLVTVRPGICAADGADGRVTLLLSDKNPAAADPQALQASLAVLSWLDRLGVRPTAAVAHGLGHLAGLVWAGAISEQDAVRLAGLRAALLRGRAASGPGAPGLDAGHPAAAVQPGDPAERLRTAVGELTLRSPWRRLISVCTGRELASGIEIADLLAAELATAGEVPSAPARRALAAGAVGATVLLETGPGRALVAAAARDGKVPGVSLGAGPGSGRDVARVAAALFAAGALADPAPLAEGRPARPIDIWRDQVFITNPCQLPPPGPPASEPAVGGPAGSEPAVGRAGTAPGAVCSAGAVSSAGIVASRGPATGSFAATPVTAGSAAVPAPASAIQGGAIQGGAIQGGGGHVRVLPAAPRGHAGPVGRAEPPGVSAPPASAPPASAPPAPGALADSAPAPLAAGTPGPGITAGRSGTGTGAWRDDPVAGAGPWIRCFAEELRAPRRRVRPGDGGPWRVRVSGRLSFGLEARAVFRDDPGADRVLAIIGDPAGAGACTGAVAAARAAAGVGRLVVVTHHCGLTGLWASLHAEHPDLGITVLRVPASPDGLRAARRLAVAEPGEFRELVVDPVGRVHEPVMTVTQTPGRAAVPIGAGDVALVGRGPAAPTLALVQALACCGVPVAVLGAAGDDDGQLTGGLDRLRAGGAVVSCATADMASAAAIDTAVRRIEQEFGRVTAIGHAVRDPAGAGLVADLDHDAVHGPVTAQAAALGQLLSAVDATRLRFIMTFGSAAGRYGLAGAGLAAVLSGSAAEQAARIAAGIPGCRALHVDWPPWREPGSAAAAASPAGGRPADGQPAAGRPADAGVAAARAAGSGPRPGIEPVTVGEGSRLLLKVLGSPGLPGRLAVHGRIGAPAPAVISAAAPGSPQGRFCEVILAHYPGVELVCEARLSLRTDPYLADYRADGLPVLPPSMALEAMAQVATALAGRPLRGATAVSMHAPVVIPAGNLGGQAVLRIGAVLVGDAVSAVLRCAESEFGLVHCRATFSDAGRADAVGLDGSELSGAGRDGPEPGGPEPDGPELDGAELYGPLCQASGRFRRIAAITQVTARSCQAIARGPDDQPWFASGPRSREWPGSPGQGGAERQGGEALILGSPGLLDATVHVLHACVPHRRVVLAGCESVTWSGMPASGPVQIRAVATADPGPLVPRPAASAATVPGVTGCGPAHGDSALGLAGQAWDVTAVDESGAPAVSWHAVRLRDVGPLPRAGAWPSALLAVYLERAGIGFGLDPGLRVTISRDHRAAAPPGPDPARPQAGTEAAAAETEAAAAGQAAGQQAAARPDPLAGLALRVQPAGSAAASCPPPSRLVAGPARRIRW